MKINRHNYETFFLLYTDNELSAAEKKMVDEFVEENMDLQEEFIMLQQSILKPQNIVFEGKNSLLKNEVQTVAIQEKLMCYLDNELDAAGLKSIHELIEGNKEVKEEWTILQKTKLVPDGSIIFADKKALYRREGGRLVGFPWLKLAVAATFLGFVVWGGIAYFNKMNGAASNPEIVTNESNKKAFVPNPLPQNKNIQQPAVIAITRVEEEIAVALTKPAAEISPEKKEMPVGKIKGSTRIKNDQQMVASRPTNNLPKPVLTKINIEERNKMVTAIVPPSKLDEHNTVPGNDVIEPRDNRNETANSFASTASFTESSEDKNNDRVLFMDEEKIKKTKLGGVFRKVKRVFERNANIKEGNNSIKVANLEFAIH